MIRISVVVFMSHLSSAYYLLFFVHFVKANGTSIDRRMDNSFSTTDLVIIAYYEAEEQCHPEGLPW